MKKNLELYIPLLNVVGIFVTLWILTIINIKPKPNTTATLPTDTIHRPFANSKYSSHYQISEKQTGKKVSLVHF
jgi:hypothetical protein